MKHELIKCTMVAFVVVCALFMMNSSALSQEDGTASSVDADGTTKEWAAEGSITVADEAKGLVTGSLKFTSIAGDDETPIVCDWAITGVMVSSATGTLLKGTIGPAAEDSCPVYGIIDAAAIGNNIQGLARDTNNNATIIFQLPLTDGEEPPGISEGEPLSK